MRFRLLVLAHLDSVGESRQWVYRIAGFADTMKEMKELYRRTHAGEPCKVERRFGADKWIQVAHSVHA